MGQHLLVCHFCLSVPPLIPLSPPGWLHVRSRRGGQHPRKQTDWLPLQNVAGSAQPAGTVVGEAPWLLPSPSNSLQSSALAPWTDAGTGGATKMRPAHASAPWPKKAPSPPLFMDTADGLTETTERKLLNALLSKYIDAFLETFTFSCQKSHFLIYGARNPRC